MAEREPTGQSVVERKQEKLAEEQAKLDRKRAILQSEEAWGKYDKDITPGLGELTYEEYEDKRPAAPEQGGIVRSNFAYQDLDNGKKPAKAEAYQQQLEDSEAAQDYYDRLGGIANTSEYQIPDYSAMNKEELLEARSKAEDLGDKAEVEAIKETQVKHYEDMGLAQLVRETVKARQSGDADEEDVIRNAVARHLHIEAMKENENSSADKDEIEKENDAFYKKELAYYEERVERYMDRLNKPVTHAEEVHVESNGEGQPSKRIPVEADASEEEEVAVAVEHPHSAEVEETTPEEEPTKPEKTEREPGYYANGEKVNVRDVFKNEKGEKIVAVFNADGKTFYIPEDELEIVTPPAREPGKELELRQKPGELELAKAVDDEEALNEKEVSKKWWQKARDGILLKAGMLYFKARFEAKTRWDNYLNSHLDDYIVEGDSEETKEEKREQKRKDNRYLAVAVGSGVAALTLLVSGLLVAKGLSSGHSVASVGLGEHNDWAHNHPGMGHNLETPPPAPAPHFESISAIKGEGGLALFGRLGIPASKWAEHANDLLTQFPKDFELNPQGTGVWIAHSGPLTPEAQNYINSLR